MVERFMREFFEMKPNENGLWVNYSDYAALEAQLAERVKVKPLEWVELNEGKAFRALLPVIGSIRIEPYGVCGWWEVLWSMPGQCDKLIPDVFDTPDEAKAAAQADCERRILSALEATPPAPTEPNFSQSIADVIKEESASGAAVGWRSCTGCHETNEGYETGHFPYSKMFGCYVGSGCSECGGIGVTWEYWSEADLKAMAENIPTPPALKVTEEIVVCPDCDGQKLMHGYDCDCPTCAATGVVPMGTAIRSILDDDDADVFEKLADIRLALTAAQESGQ